MAIHPSDFGETSPEMPSIGIHNDFEIDFEHLHESEGDFEAEVIDIQSDEKTKLIHGRARVAGAGVEYTYEEPREITDYVPLLMVNGYMGVKSAYRDVRHAVALEGKPAATIKPARNQGFKERFDIRHRLHPELLPSMAVGAVMKAIERKHGAEKFDVSGHSMGGFVATNVAEHMPDRVRTLILVASAGLDKHNLTILGGRAVKFVRNELAPSFPALRATIDPAVAKQEAEYIFANPLRTLAEGYAVANCNIRGQLKRVGALGVKTAALQFESDELFPLHGVAERSAGIVDVFRIYPDRTIGHLGPQLQPIGVAHEQLDILDTLHGKN